MTTEAGRDAQVARETVRPAAECPHCNPPGRNPFRGFDGSGAPVYDYGPGYEALRGAKR